MNNYGKNRIKRDIFSFFSIGILIQILIRLSYLQEVAKDNLGDNYNPNAYNNFLQNPILGGLSGFFNFFIGNWGNSLLTGQPVVNFLLPFIEKEIFFMSYLLLGLIFGGVLPYLIIKYGNAFISQIFSSYLLIGIFSVIYVSMFLSDPRPYLFSAYSNIPYDNNHPGGQLLVQISTVLITLMLTQKSLRILAKMEKDEVTPTFAVVYLNSFKSQMNYFAMIWISIGTFLSAPILGNLLVITILVFDYTMVMAIIMYYLVFYHLILLFVDFLILQLEDTKDNIVTDTFNNYSVKTWKKFLTISVGVLILSLSLLGFLVFPDFMDQSSQLSPRMSIFPAFLIDSDYGLPLTSRSLSENIMLVCGSFSIITIIVLVQVLAVISVGSLNIDTEKHKSYLLMIDQIRYFPSYLLVGIMVLLFINPFQNLILTIFVLTFLTLFLKLPYIVPLLIETSRVSFGMVLKVFSEIVSLNFFILMYAGLFNNSVGIFYINNLSQVSTFSQLYLFIYFTVFIAILVLVISSTGITSDPQENIDLYPANEGS